MGKGDDIADLVKKTKKKKTPEKGHCHIIPAVLVSSLSSKKFPVAFLLAK